MGMGEETLRFLLEDDRLECEKEEGVFEGLVRWGFGLRITFLVVFGSSLDFSITFC